MNVIDYLTTWGVLAAIGVGICVALLPVLYVVYRICRLFGFRDLFPKTPKVVMTVDELLAYQGDLDSKNKRNAITMENALSRSLEENAIAAENSLNRSLEQANDLPLGTYPIRY
jgi:hypothetical protein